jgi:hypothetical protein
MATLEQFEKDETLQAIIRRLQKQLKDAKARSEELVMVTKEAAFDAMYSLGPIAPVEKPTYTRSNKGAEVALWDMGDWQGSKVTTTYNSQVMVERVMRFTRKAGLIGNIQRSDHPVKDAYVIFGGDMVEGLFNFPSQVFEVDSTIFEQYVTVSRLLVDVVRACLAQHEKVTVIAEWGNHGRIGSKRDAVPRHDNIDRMCYELARQLLAGEKRLAWEDCPEDIQHLEIGEYRALVAHGDEVGRTGYVSPAQMMNHINKWKSGSYPWKFQDVYLHHYHQHMELPLPDGAGAVYYTGSTESDNRYALMGMAASAIPTQRLHFIHPALGRVTNQYKVFLNTDK